MSDSGGVQEEAPSLGKPVLVLREVTERPEGVEVGTLKLVGTTENGVYAGAKELLDDKVTYDAMAGAKNPYGDGFASKYIVDAILYAPKPLGTIGIDSKFPLENYQIMVDKNNTKSTRESAEKLFKVEDGYVRHDALKTSYLIFSYIMEEE